MLADTMALMFEALGTATPAPRTNKPTATTTSHSVLKKRSKAVDGAFRCKFTRDVRVAGQWSSQPCRASSKSVQFAGLPRPLRQSDDCLYSRTRDIHRGCVSASTNKVRSTCSHHTLGSQLPAYRHRKTQHGSVCKGKQRLCICTVRTTD